MATMTKRERVRAALAGGDVDRLPIMFWHHFRPHGSPQKLADATLDFFGRHDLDIYKIMPDIPYPFPRDSIRAADDWLFLSPLDVLEGNLGRMVTATELTYENLPNDEPLIVTMFSPFCYAMNSAGSANISRHLKENPARVHEALSVIAHNLASFSQALIAHGADGIFFASQGAGDGILTREQYKEFGVPYDLQVLRGAQDAWLNVLHIHGFENLMVDLFVDYPASVFSWSDRLSGRSLRDMRKLGAQRLPDGRHRREGGHHQRPRRPGSRGDARCHRPNRRRSPVSSSPTAAPCPTTPTTHSWPGHAASPRRCDRGDPSL